MKSEIVVRKNMTLTNEKVKNMCRLNYEDNDFLFTTQYGRCVIIDKSKGIINIEGDDDNNIQEYKEYLQNILEKRKDKIILTTLSPDTHRTSEENLGLSYLTAVLRKSGYNVEIILRALELYAYNLDYMLNSNDSATDIGQEKKALLKYTYEQVLATQAEQVQSKSNNIDNIPEIGKLIIKEGMKNNGLYVQLNAG